VSRRVLIACFETPGHGGAGTAAYDLFEQAQRDGAAVSFVNLVDRHTVPFLERTFGPAWGNPAGLRDAHTCVLRGPFSRAQSALAELISSIGPAVILAVGYIAALAIKRTSPASAVILLTAGCDQIDRYLPLKGDALGVLDWLRSGNRPVLFNRHERHCVESVDLVIAHSTLVHELLLLFYPTHSGKIYPEVIWMAEWIHGAARRHGAASRAFDERDMDVLFVASHWSRPEKNLGLVRGIVEACRGLAMHIVGASDVHLPGCTHHGFMASRGELFSLMGRSRTVVSPSSWDAAPGILYEASALDCNIVASRNCGNWRICNPDLLVDEMSPAAFATKLRLATESRHADNASLFLETGSYATLLDVLAVF
jgi:glycosyltransferase involved in cell wall biosynthesis